MQYELEELIGMFFDVYLKGIPSRKNSRSQMLTLPLE
jgi:hypothetical protein